MTRRPSNLEDLMHDLDSESLLDDPWLVTFDEEELAMLGSGLGSSKVKSTPVEKPKAKRGRPKKVK